MRGKRAKQINRLTNSARIARKFRRMYTRGEITTVDISRLTAAIRETLK